jgi:ribA/ribD-fused uncharacterized protein
MEHTRIVTGSDGKQYVLFETGWSPLSTSHPSRFVLYDVSYRSALQMYEAMKAKEFGDLAAYKMIMNSRDAKTQANLGGAIRNYDPALWDQKADATMERALRLKFEQNDDAKAFLLKTGNATIVFTTDKQTYWGNGLKATDEGTADPAKWKGNNKLGKILMKIRADMCNSDCVYE